VPRFELYGAIGSHPPTVIVTDVPWDDPAGVLAVVEQHEKVFMRLTPIDTTVEHLSCLWNVNPGMLCITLPRFTAKGIRYGLFGTGTTDNTCLKIWRKIARDFYRLTSGGLWGVFPSTQRTKYNPDKRYTSGAAELWRAGVKLWGAGDDTWHLTPPTP
jgi:hypothetical protein